jgi:hypothetical protein
MQKRKERIDAMFVTVKNIHKMLLKILIASIVVFVLDRSSIWNVLLCSFAKLQLYN